MLIISLIPSSKQEIIKIKKQYPDYWLEYRLDLCNDWNFIDKETVDENTILTIRYESEAGNNVNQLHKPPVEEKIKNYSQLIKEYNCLVDIEESIYNKLPHNLRTQIPLSNLILSLHYFSDTWELSELKRRCRNIERINCRFGKIAVNNESWQRFDEISQIIHSAEISMLYACMGDEGLSRRLLYKHIGATGTYLCLPDRETATGQLDIKLAEKLKLNKIKGKELQT